MEDTMSGNQSGNHEEIPGANADANYWMQIFQQQQQRQQQQHDQMMQVLQQQQKQIMEMVQQQNERQHRPPSPPLGQQQEVNRTFHEFYKMKPPFFEGKHDPKEAREWIKRMEKVFKVAPCSEEDKVVFAVHMLKGAAEDWWEGERDVMVANNTPMNWTQFKTALLTHYVPHVHRVNMEQEFLQLRQNNMSMSEYSAKFMELSRFSSNVKHAKDEQWKIDQFKVALRGDIEHAVVGFKFETFKDLLQQCYAAEGTLNKIKREKDTWNNKKQSGKFDHQLKPKGSLGKGKQIQQSRPPIQHPACRNCGKTHHGECMFGQGVCYLCKESGHLKRDCPLLKKKKGSDFNAPTTGRVYALDVKKAKGNNELIAGTEVQSSGGNK